MLTCRESAQFLVGVMQEMVCIEGLPGSVPETQRLIDQHEECVRKAIDDARMLTLQEEGEATLHTLSNMHSQLNNYPDYRSDTVLLH